MRTSIERQQPSEREPSPYRGTLSHMLRQMGPVSRLYFHGEKVKHPYQTCHYHNKRAAELGEPFRWSARRDIVGRWFIRRSDDEALKAQLEQSTTLGIPNHLAHLVNPQILIPPAE